MNVDYAAASAYPALLMGDICQLAEDHKMQMQMQMQMPSCRLLCLVSL